MKKLFTVTLLAGLLSMPSVVFAEASWYGSLRSTVEFGGGSDARFLNAGSRWGIKGSAEAGEGLTAVYRFEHNISTSDASQPGGRLAYVGLSGGFGTITAGQIWNAAFNHVGSITDNSMYHGNSETGYRHGNAVSYAVSAGTVSLQMDLIMDPNMDTGGAIDKTEFGLTVGLGEIGKVAFAHTNMKDVTKTFTEQKITAGTPPTVTITGGDPATAPVVTPGTPATVTGGTPTMVTPGEPAKQKYKDQDVLNASGSVTGATLKDGKVSYADTARWSINGSQITGATIGYKEDEVKKTMQSLNLQASDGAVGGSDFMTLTPGSVILNTTTAPTTATSGYLNKGDTTDFAKNADGAYVASACQGATPGANCTAYEVLVAEYYSSDTADQVPGDGGVSIFATRISYVGVGEGTIRHTAVVELPDGITDGTETTVVAGTPVTVTPGTPATVVAGKDGTPVVATVTPGTPATLTDVENTKVEKGHKTTHVAFEFGLGGVTTYVGHTTKKVNGASGKSKTTHFGVHGGLGDTGMSFRAMARNKKGADGASSTPWLFGVSRSLGGGASLHFEHGNDDDGESGNTRVGMQVNF